MLSLVEDLNAIDDLQALLDRLAEAVARVAGWQVGVLSVYLPEGRAARRLQPPRRGARPVRRRDVDDAAREARGEAGADPLLRVPRHRHLLRAATTARSSKGIRLHAEPRAASAEPGIPRTGSSSWCARGRGARSACSRSTSPSTVIGRAPNGSGRCGSRSASSISARAFSTTACWRATCAAARRPIARSSRARRSASTAARSPGAWSPPTRGSRRSSATHLRRRSSPTRSSSRASTARPATTANGLDTAGEVRATDVRAHKLDGDRDPRGRHAAPRARRSRARHRRGRHAGPPARGATPAHPAPRGARHARLGRRPRLQQPARGRARLRVAARAAARGPPGSGPAWRRGSRTRRCGPPT